MTACGGVVVGYNHPVLRTPLYFDFAQYKLWRGISHVVFSKAPPQRTLSFAQRARSLGVGLCCCPSSTSCVGFAYTQGDSMWLDCGLLFRLLDLRSQASSKASLSSCFNDTRSWVFALLRVCPARRADT